MSIEDPVFDPDLNTLIIYHSYRKDESKVCPVGLAAAWVYFKHCKTTCTMVAATYEEDYKWSSFEGYDQVVMVNIAPPTRSIGLDLSSKFKGSGNIMIIDNSLSTRTEYLGDEYDIQQTMPRALTGTWTSITDHYKRCVIWTYFDLEQSGVALAFDHVHGQLGKLDKIPMPWFICVIDANDRCEPDRFPDSLSISLGMRVSDAYTLEMFDKFQNDDSEYMAKMYKQRGREAKSVINWFISQASKDATVCKFGHYIVLLQQLSGPVYKEMGDYLCEKHPESEKVDFVVLWQLSCNKERGWFIDYSLYSSKKTHFDMSEIARQRGGSLGGGGKRYARFQTEGTALCTDFVLM